MATSSAAVESVRRVEGKEKEWSGNDCNKGRGFPYLPQIWWGLLKALEIIFRTPALTVTLRFPGDRIVYP